MTFRYSIRTRYSETGQDGIIHHSSFVVYLEVAHIEFLRSMGVDINEYEKVRKIYCPVVDLSIHYRKPLYSSEDIEVCIKLDSHSKARFRLAYNILRKDECVATAITTFCFLNASFRPIPIPKEVIASFLQCQSSP